MLADVPSPSRNYTHVIVAEAGVSAPLPDRTGRNLNLATEPGAQAEDGSQTLNPSVNGARPTNNALRVNGIDTTNMLSASGGLGGSLGVPLEALQEIEVQTSLTSAAQGRNGGGSIDIVTRQGTNRFNGTGLYAFQHESMNANEFFLNRAGTAKPEFRRNDASGAARRSDPSGPHVLLRRRAEHSLPLRLRQQRHGGDRPAGRPRRRADAGDHRPRRQRLAAQRRGRQRGVRGQLPARAARVPGRTAGRPDRHVLQRRERADVPPADGADIHPVAINILNTKRDGRFLIPSTTGGMPVLPGNGTFGRELLLQQVIPTESNGWSGVATVQHRVGSGNDTRVTFVRSPQQVEEAFGWADASPSPTDGNTPALLGGVTNTHTFGSRLLQEVSVGYFDLENTRISKNRDIYNSSLGIRNPLEAVDRRPGRADADHRHQHAAQLRRHRQRVGLLRSPARAARVRALVAVAGRHTLQSGVEYGGCGSTASTCRAPTATSTTTTGCSSSPATAPRAAARISIRAIRAATSAPRTPASSSRTTGRWAAA